MLEITAEKDQKEMGSDRVHYVFPAHIKRPYDRAALPSIAGGIWIKRGVEVPETILIKLSKHVTEEEETEEEEPEEEPRPEELE